MHREDDCKVVTAITSVKSLGPGKPVEQDMFLVRGLLYGKGITDTKTKPPHGWRVSLTTLFNNDISAMLKAKWNKTQGKPLFSCCKSGIASSIKPEDLEVPGKDCAITIDWKDDNKSLEIRWAELPDAICRFTAKKVLLK